MSLPDVLSGGAHVAAHNDERHAINDLQTDASWRYRGAGSPEGVVTAPIGAEYTDTAATNGAVRWVKYSGTGNTGWKVTYGDTGLRDVTSSISAALDPTNTGTMSLRRINETVIFKIENLLLLAGSGSLSIWASVPLGFRSISAFGGCSQVFRSNSFGQYQHMVLSSANLSWISEVNRVAATVTSTTTRPTVTIRGQLVVPTADAWPTSLPGV